MEETIYNRQIDKMCVNNLLVSEGSSTGKPTKRDSFDLLKSSLFQVVDHDKLKDAVLNDFVLSSHKKMYLSLKQVDDASESRKRKIEKKWKRGLQKFEKKLTVVLTKGPQSSTDLLTRFKPLIKKYGLLAQAIRAVLRKKASLNKKELRWHLKGSL